KRALIVAAMGLVLTGPALAESCFYIGMEGGFAFFKDTADEQADAYLANGVDTANVEQDRASLVVRPFIGLVLTDHIDLEFGAGFFSRRMTVDGTYGPYS
ncbi:hypothetical protein ACQV5M_19975, partial [Leptospira sp. SA-E8]|uniref:hypothetical protein n=1 Tax=Leptospira sp. SA-E8 TaxID=3422259 RepID=UPI003EB9E7FA